MSVGRTIIGLGLHLNRLIENGRRVARTGTGSIVEVDYKAAEALALEIRNLGASVMAEEIGRRDLGQGALQ